jgi:hypothetical protein
VDARLVRAELGRAPDRDEVAFCPLLALVLRVALRVLAPRPRAALRNASALRVPVRRGVFLDVERELPEAARVDARREADRVEPRRLWPALSPSPEPPRFPPP